MKTQHFRPGYSKSRGLDKGCMIIRRSILSIAFAALSIGTALAQPSWYDPTTQSGIEPGSPDFYQHQITGTITNGGFCDYFAYEDAMYYDSNNGFPNLYANNANWVNAMNTNFFNIYASGGNINVANPAFMTSYIANQSYGASLGVNSMTNSSGGYSIFNAFEQNLLAGSNVLIRILDGTNTNQWWNFHVMDAVGFNATNHTIVVLDPDNNMYGGFGLPGVPPNNLVYYTNSEPFPIESGWGDVGNPTNSLLQAYTVDANGNITDGIYAGTRISNIYAIGPVPEPSVFALGLASVTIFGAYRLARRKKESAAGRRDGGQPRGQPLRGSRE
jgi:hypothetical protein